MNKRFKKITALLAVTSFYTATMLASAASAPRLADTLAQDLDIDAVVSSISRTSTNVGKAALKNILSQGPTSLEAAKRGQATVKAIVEDEELRSRLSSLFESAKSSEENASELLRVLGCKDSMLGFDSTLPGINWKCFKHTSPGWTDFCRGTKTIGTPLAAAGQVLTAVAMDNLKLIVGVVIGYAIAKGAGLKNLSEGLKVGKAVAKDAYEQKKHIINPILITTTVLATAGILISHIFNEKRLFASDKKLFDLTKALCKLSDYAKDLASELEEHKSLAWLADDVRNYFSEDGENSIKEQIEGILEIAQTKTYKQDVPAYVSRMGRVRAVYARFKKIRPEIEKLVSFLGNVEAHLSMAKLMKEHEGQQNVTGSTTEFSFIDFIENAEQPELQLKDAWHPVVPQSEAVTNDIHLGSGAGFNGMMISGANKGGKSVAMKLVGLAAGLIGPAFGIAPASSARMTFFDTVRTSLNVSDNIATGESKHLAECRRAIECVETAKASSKDKFALLILDELFSGTEPKPAEALVCAFGKSIAQQPNTLCLLSSHYPRVKQLESMTNGQFKNFCVEITHDANGELVFPYKLTRGTTNINIAIDVLQRDLKQRKEQSRSEQSQSEQSCSEENKSSASDFDKIIEDARGMVA
ncbi:hypothetical protein HOD08_02980 [bacterium]|nr:hypothetical protein [bacterium]